MDFAINGSGFFVIETSKGLRYTRDGRFTLNSQGELVTLDGHRVMGTGGPIVIPQRGEIKVDRSGTIRVNGRVVDTFLIVDFPPTGGISKEGENRFTVSSNLQPLPSNVEVLQGYVEESNVEIVKEMVEMIATLRNYESYQKAIQAMDSTVQQLNEFAKV